MGWAPGDVVGSGPEGLVGWVTATQYGDGGAIEDRQAVGQARSTRGMTILIPPAVFEEEVAVFDLPMIADMGQQLVGRDLRRIEAGNKIAAIVRNNVAGGSDHVTVDAQSDPAAGKSQLVANVICVVQGEPEPAAICQSPLFSCVSAAGGRLSACPKHERKASCTSGWLALT